MAMNLGTAQARITLDSSDFESGANRAGQSMQNLDGSVGRSTKSFGALGGVLVGVGGAITAGFTAPVIAGTKAAWDYADSMQQSRVALNAYEKDGRKVDKLMSDLVEYSTSKRSGGLFFVDELAASSSSMRVQGAETENLAGYTEILSRSVGLGTGNWSELNRIVGRVGSTGRITSEDFDMLTKMGYKLDDSIRNTDTTWEGLFKHLDKGIPADALEGQAGTIRASMAWLRGALLSVGAAFLGLDLTTGEFAKGSLGETLVNGLSQATAMLNAMVPAVQKVGRVIASAAKIGATFLDFLIGLPVPIQTAGLLATVTGGAFMLMAGAFLLVLPQIIAVGTALKALGGVRGILMGLTSAVRAFSASLLFNPVLLGIAVAVGALYLAWKFNFLGIRDVVGSVVDSVTGFIDRFKSAIDDLTTAVPGGTTMFGDFAVTIEHVSGSVNIVSAAFLALSDAIRGINGGDIPDWLETVADGMETAGKAVENFVDGFTDVWDTLDDSIPGGTTMFGDFAVSIDHVAASINVVSRLFYSLAAGLRAVVSGGGPAWLGKLANGFEFAGEQVEAFLGYIDSVRSASNAFTTDIGNMAEPLRPFALAIGLVVDTVDDLVDAFGEGGFSSLMDAIPGEIDDLIAGFKRIWSEFGKGLVVDLANWTVNVGVPGVTGAASSLWSAVSSWVTGTAWPAVSGAAVTVGGVLVDVGSFLKNRVPDIFSEVASWFTDTAWPAALDAATSVGGVLVDIGSWAQGEVIEPVWDFLKKWVNGLVGGGGGNPSIAGGPSAGGRGNAPSIENVMVNIGSWAQGEVEDVWGFVKKWVQGLIGGGGGGINRGGSVAGGYLGQGVGGIDIGDIAIKISGWAIVASATDLWSSLKGWIDDALVVTDAEAAGFEETGREIGRKTMEALIAGIKAIFKLDEIIADAFGGGDGGSGSVAGGPSGGSGASGGLASGGSFGDGLWRYIKPMVDGAWEVLKPELDAWAQDTKRKIEGWWNSIAPSFLEFSRDYMTDNSIAGSPGERGGGGSFGSGIATKFKGMIDGAWSSVQSAITGAFADLKSKISGLWDSLTSTLFDSVFSGGGGINRGGSVSGGYLGQGGSNITSWLTDALAGIGSDLKSAWDGFWDGFSLTKPDIDLTSFLPDFSLEMSDITGWKTASSTIEGISGKWDSLWQGVSLKSFEITLPDISFPTEIPGLDTFIGMIGSGKDAVIEAWDAFWDGASGGDREDPLNNPLEETRNYAPMASSDPTGGSSRPDLRMDRGGGGNTIEFSVSITGAEDATTKIGNLKTAFDGLKTGAQTALQTVTVAVTTQASAWSTIVTAQAPMMTMAGTTLGNAVKLAMQTSLQTVTVAVTTQSLAWSTIITAQAPLMTLAGTTIGNAVKLAMQLALQTTTVAVTTQSAAWPVIIGSQAGAMSANAAMIAESARASLAAGLQSGTVAVTTHAGAWPVIVGSYAGAMSAAGSNVGAAATSGVADGMLSVLWRVTAAANMVADEVDRALRSAAKIASPSKRMMYHGRMMTAGVGVGAIKAIPLVQDAARKVVNGITGVYDNAARTLAIDKLSKFTQGKQYRALTQISGIVGKHMPRTLNPNMEICPDWNRSVENALNTRMGRLSNGLRYKETFANPRYYEAGGTGRNGSQTVTVNHNYALNRDDYKTVIDDSERGGRAATSLGRFHRGRQMSSGRSRTVVR